jgi:hypothetical protein
MNTQPNLPASERACPLAFLVVPAFLSALVWLYALLSHVAAP